MDKIAIVIDGISNSGGTDRVAANVSNMFVEYGFDVTLYSLSLGEPYYRISDKVDIAQFTHYPRIYNLVKVAYSIKKGNFKHTIVVSMGRLSTQLIPLLRIILNDTTIVCSDHVSIESFPVYIRMLKYLAYKLSDNLVVLTEHDKFFLRKVFKKKPINVIRNQSPFSEVDCDKSLSRISRANEKIIIAVGRLTAQKNFSKLLDIWSKANVDNWELYIIGDGEEKDELIQKVEDNNLNNAHIISATKDLQSWYQRASLLLMTSKYEGLPMVLIEAKSFGLPVIAFDCKTGPREIISDDGILVESDNEQDFILHLNELTLNHNKRLTMSSNAFRNAHKYSKEYIFKQWSKVIK